MTWKSRSLWIQKKNLDAENPPNRHVVKIRKSESCTCGRPGQRDEGRSTCPLRTVYSPALTQST